MYRNDELSSIVQAQDDKLCLEEARINAENVHHAVTEELEHARFRAEAAHHEVSRQLEQERQAKASISRILESRDNQLSTEISELTIDRQEAVLRYEFACTQHNDDLMAIRQDNNRLRQQLYAAYTMRDNYRQLVDELSSRQPVEREVPISEFVSMQNRLWSMEQEHALNVQKLDEVENSRGEYEEKLAQLRERHVALEKEKNELTMRLAYIQGATQAARELLEKERLEQEEAQRTAAASSAPSDRLRSQETQTVDDPQDSRSSAQNSFLLIGTSQAAPATSSTIRNELDGPDEEATEEV